jgi:hypothetical protein
MNNLLFKIIKALWYEFSDSAGKKFLCPGPACPLLSAYPLNYNLFAEQLLEFLAGALRDLAHKTFFDPHPFFCGLNGCHA